MAFFVSSALAFNASAMTMVDITFTATSGTGTTGSNSITASAGDTLTAAISISPDDAGISSYSISALFDMDFGNELDLLSANELLNAPFQFNVNPGCASTQESTGGQVGDVFSCEAATFGAGPVQPVTVDIFELVFQVTVNVATDGFDIQAGFFNTGFDGAFDNAGGSVTPIFGMASVNLVPEPNTALLVGFGLLGFTVCARKRSR